MKPKIKKTNKINKVWNSYSKTTPSSFSQWSTSTESSTETVDVILQGWTWIEDGKIPQKFFILNWSTSKTKSKAMQKSMKLSDALTCTVIASFTTCFATVAKSTQLLAESYLTSFLKKPTNFTFHLALLASQGISQRRLALQCLKS